VLALLSSSSFISSGGYLAIFVLCVAQSCCIPTSSELTMGFAGYLAATGKLNLPAAIAVGAAGETIGAYIAWIVGRTGGRSFVERYGRLVLITRTDLDRAEAWYGRHERSGVFVGRLLPVIRSFVALVAGVAEVPLVSFGIFTLLGSALWDGAMAGIGYGVGSNYDRVVKVFSDAGYVLAVLAVIVIVFGFVHRLRSYRHLRELELQQAAAGTTPGAQPAGAGTGTATTRIRPVPAPEHRAARRGPRHRRD
jgi:membrane protein DedA with SNARE-associated domain